MGFLVSQGIPYVVGSTGKARGDDLSFVAVRRVIGSSFTMAPSPARRQIRRERTLRGERTERLLERTCRIWVAKTRVRFVLIQ